LQGLVDAGVVKRNQPRSADMTSGPNTPDIQSPTSNASRIPNASTNFR